MVGVECDEVITVMMSCPKDPQELSNFPPRGPLSRLIPVEFQASELDDVNEQEVADAVRALKRS